MGQVTTYIIIANVAMYQNQNNIFFGDFNFISHVSMIFFNFPKCMLPIEKGKI